MRPSNGLRRARAALERHGVLALTAIALRVLRGQGLGKTVRLAAGDQPFLSLVSARAEGAAKSDRRGALQIDGGGTVSASAWARWVRRPSARSGRSSGRRCPVAFVVWTDPESPDGLERTRKAIDALGSSLAVIEDADFTPSPEILYIFLRAGDAPDAGFVQALDADLDGAIQIVSFDLLRLIGERVQPLLLPGANPTQLIHTDYVRSRLALKGSVLLEVATREPRGATQAWCARRSVAEVRSGWRHIGRPLLRIEQSEDGLSAGSSRSVQRASPRAVPRARRGASAIICTRDKGHLTRQLVRQLLALDKDQLAEVVILSNGATNPYALQTLADLAAAPRVRVIAADEPFNFSRLCNRGVRETRGQGPLLFLNDDIAPVSENWLGALADQLMVPGTGAVGPLLLYPNEKVQCAGIYLRFPSGVGHILRGAVLPQEDPLGLASSPREAACLTGAVLLTDRATFERVGGFDEALALSFQDVDYGLKLHQLGLRNVFEPRSILLHMESVSLDKAGSDPGMLLQRHREKALFMQRWGPVFGADPFYPAGLDLDDESGRRLSRR